MTVSVSLLERMTAYVLDRKIHYSHDRKTREPKDQTYRPSGPKQPSAH